MNEWNEIGQSFNNSRFYIVIYFVSLALALALALTFTHSIILAHSLIHINVNIYISCMRLFYGPVRHNTHLEWIIFIECDYFQHFAKTLEYLMQNVQRDGIQKRLNYHT